MAHRFREGLIGWASAGDVQKNRATRQKRPGKSGWQRLLSLFRRDLDDPPIPEVWVPAGAHVILNAIPQSFQQTYGLEEEEGAVLLDSGSDFGAGPALAGSRLRFYNGVKLRVQHLREGQPVEVLSLAGAGLKNEAFALRLTARLRLPVDPTPLPPSFREQLSGAVPRGP